MLIVGIIACLFLWFETTAFADWQYTRWEMTVEEVIKASNGEAKAHPKSKEQSKHDEQDLLIATYKTGSFVFTVNFEFKKDTQRLTRVRCI